MPKSIHPEYTAHLLGAPERRTWPLMPLIGVGVTSILAGMAFIFMLISLA